MKITIEEIQSAFNLIMNSIKEQGIEEIEISEDYFWNIDKKELYDMQCQPENLTIGSIVEDINEIKKINNHEYTPIGYNLRNINSAIRYLSDNVL